MTVGLTKRARGGPPRITKLRHPDEWSSTMTTSPAEVLQALLSNPVDLENVKKLTIPDVTYVSLSQDNPELKNYLPWTGTSKGPEAIVRTFQGVGRAWETKAFEVRDTVEQGDSVAMFGSFTFRARESGNEVTSLFSILAKVKDGKITYVQFLEDTFGTSATLGRPWKRWASIVGRVDRLTT
jgi:ketosteroid isomerase-like protein